MSGIAARGVSLGMAIGPRTKIPFVIPSLEAGGAQRFHGQHAEMAGSGRERLRLQGRGRRDPGGAFDGAGRGPGEALAGAHPRLELLGRRGGILKALASVCGEGR